MVRSDIGNGISSLAFGTFTVVLLSLYQTLDRVVDKNSYLDGYRAMIYTYPVCVG